MTFRKLRRPIWVLLIVSTDTHSNSQYETFRVVIDHVLQNKSTHTTKKYSLTPHNLHRIDMDVEKLNQIMPIESHIYICVK